MNTYSAKPNWLARTFDLESEVGEKLWRHGVIYFTELLLLWIVTTSGDLNHALLSIGNFEVNVMKLQTLGFVWGGFYFGWWRGENWKKEKWRQGILNTFAFFLVRLIFLGFWRKETQQSNRIKNLKISLWLYIIGALLSGIFTFPGVISSFKNPDLTNWVFAISRVITCIGISGGIGINLTILALSAKNGKHSAPILLFTVFGVLGTVLCCLLLVCFPWEIVPPIIFSIGAISAGGQIWRLKKDAMKNPAKYNGEEYINQYEYKVNLSEFWSRIAPFVILGLPTFYLAGILASEADLLITRGWFGGKEPVENISALFLGIQYLGFALICISASIKGKKSKIRQFISERRKLILSVGGIIQIVFIAVFFLCKDLYWAFSVLVIFLSGVGIGINWGILMILIFEQEEFQKAQTYAATIIPNIIRFSLFFILLFPPLLKLGIDDTKNQDHKISQLGGLAVLVYLPFVFTLLVFKDKGEKQARYALEDKRLREIVDEIINQQKTNNQNREINTEAPNELLQGKFADLKQQLRDALKAQTFDLINFYYQFDGGSIIGTEFTDEEDRNKRAKTIKNILKPSKEHETTNLIKLASTKRLSFVVVHKSRRKFENEADLSIDLNDNDKTIIDNIKAKLKINQFTDEEEESLIDNFDRHRRAAEDRPDEDYFVYIVRPIEDIADVDTYLILQRPTYIADRAIGSFQTLIDLILLKHGKNLQQRLEAEVNVLNNKVQEKESENLLLKRAKNDLEICVGIKQNRITLIQGWRDKVKNDELEEVFQELIKYTKEFKKKGFEDNFTKLCGELNGNNRSYKFNIVSTNDYQLTRNRIRNALTDLLRKLEEE